MASVAEGPTWLRRGAAYRVAGERLLLCVVGNGTHHLATLAGDFFGQARHASWRRETGGRKVG